MLWGHYLNTSAESRRWLSDQRIANTGQGMIRFRIEECKISSHYSEGHNLTLMSLFLEFSILIFHFWTLVDYGQLKLRKVKPQLDLFQIQSIAKMQ